MFRVAQNQQPNQSLNQMAQKEARIRQLPSSRRWIVSSRTSLVMVSFVLVSWIVMSLMNESLFLKEAVTSSFIIGCSVLFNKSSFARDTLNE